MPRFDKKHGALLWFASGFVREAYCGTFCQMCRDSAKHTMFSLCCTRRCTFRDSVKVRRTQRDKHGARYAALISATAGRLLHSFWRILYIEYDVHTVVQYNSTLQYNAVQSYPALGHTHRHTHPLTSSSTGVLTLWRSSTSGS